ncbi:MAG: glutamate--tRNA ligase [Chloroflexi bacterium]|nr:glutamate--tRNA ligase [Chloroflexota bacterium]
MIRVRFAPSPTGYLHIGSVRTALFNYLFARRQGGKFILRIEDTDRERSNEAFLEEILENLKWMGLEWDEGPGAGGDYGPYFQMERLKIYREHAQKLLDEDKAYYCYCTPEELAAERELANLEKRSPGYSGKCMHITEEQQAQYDREGRDPSIRFKVPASGEVVIDDLIRGKVSFDNCLLEDFIIMKSSGIPVYNFAAVIDDSLMHISHVIRGEEHLSNTPRQLLLYRALGYPPPEFAHLPIILDEQRRKLSKRRGGVDLRDFRMDGYLPEAIFNFLALLGWSPGEDLELMERDDVIGRFTLDAVSKSPSVFDDKKLEWMNAQYMKKKTPAEIADLSEPFFMYSGYEPERRFLEELSELYCERIKKLSDFPVTAACFFDEHIEYDPDAAIKYFKEPGVTAKRLRDLEDVIAELDDYNKETIEKAVRGLAEKLGVAAAKLIHPARVALTGKATSPGIFEVMELMDKPAVLSRLIQAAEYLEEKNKAKAEQ